MEEKRQLRKIWDGSFDTDSWKRAGELISGLGYISGPFIACIRHLRNPQRRGKGGDTLDSTGRWLVNRFVGNPVVRSRFYYLSLTFHEDKIKDKKKISICEIVDLYTPNELAAILALLYLSRTLKFLCDPAQWPLLSKAAQESVEIGAWLASKMRMADMSDGLLVPGMRYFSLGLLLQSDKDKFCGYHDSVFKQKGGFDCAKELELWGCSHVQIAILLLERLGFGLQYGTDFKEALCTPPERHLPFAINRLRMLAFLTDSLYLGFDLPAIAGDEEFEMSEQSLQQFHEKAKAVIESGSRYGWLQRSNEEVLTDTIEGMPSAPQTKPEPAPSSVSADPFSIPYEELPENIRRHFPKEELDTYRSEIKELLRK